MLVGLIVVVTALALASAFGVWRKRTDGAVKVRGMSEREAADSVITSTLPADDTGGPDDAGASNGAAAGAKGRKGSGAEVLDSGRLGQALGERATLVQFSTVFCQPCRAAKVVLSDIAGRVPGVAHVELDAESHLDLVRELGIMRTPTTLILDGAGRITARASGVPRREQVLAALGASVS